MLKIFPRKIVQSKVNIYADIPSPYKNDLQDARGVMDNYLRKQKCTVSIRECPLHDGDAIEVSAINDAKNSTSRISVFKEGEIPFLRKIYKAIEIVTKDVTKKS